MVRKVPRKNPRPVRNMEYGDNGQPSANHSGTLPPSEREQQALQRTKKTNLRFSSKQTARKSTSGLAFSKSTGYVPAKKLATISNRGNKVKRRYK